MHDYANEDDYDLQDIFAHFWYFLLEDGSFCKIKFSQAFDFNKTCWLSYASKAKVHTTTVLHRH